MHRQVLRLGRRVAVAVIGGAVIVAGVVLAMPLVPGPGLALILLGLGILSLEFQWPRVWLARIKAKGSQLGHRLFRWPRVWLARIKAKGSQLKHRLFRKRSQPGDGQ